MKRIAALGGAIGLFLIMMIAASMQGTATITPPPQSPVELPPPPSVESSPMPTESPLPQPPASDLLSGIIGVVFFVLLLAAAVIIIVLIVRALVRAWRDRPLSAQDGAEVDSELEDIDGAPEPEVAAPVIQRGIAGALRTIDAREVPTDAIVAAWVGLEESAADAGIARGVSETPAEFALRIITQRAAITSAAHDLLRLYERARFGGYVAQETDRDAARAALQHIEEGWR